jgi:hypothetical protein
VSATFPRRGWFRKPDEWRLHPDDSMQRPTDWDAKEYWVYQVRVGRQRMHLLCAGHAAVGCHEASRLHTHPRLRDGLANHASSEENRERDVTCDVVGHPCCAAYKAEADSQ